MTATTAHAELEAARAEIDRLRRCARRCIKWRARSAPTRACWTTCGRRRRETAPPRVLAALPRLIVMPALSLRRVQTLLKSRGHQIRSA